MERGGGGMEGLGQLMALSAYLMAGSEKEKKILMVGVGNERFATDGR